MFVPKPGPNNMELSDICDSDHPMTMINELSKETHYFGPFHHMPTHV